MKKTLLFGEPMTLLLADTPGALECVEHFRRRMSGAEVNVAIGLTRLGFPVEYLTRLGDDPFGHYIEQALKDNGIGTNLLTYDTVYRTGIQLKEYVEDGHDPAAPYYRKGSAASHLSAQEIDALDLEEIGLVHVTGIPPALSKEAREATYRLMERAREAQIPVTFDPNLRPALWENGETMRNVLNDLANYADFYFCLICGQPDFFCFRCGFICYNNIVFFCFLCILLPDPAAIFCLYSNKRRNS